MEMNVDELFNQLLNQYPQFLLKYAESIWQDVDSSKDELLTDEVANRVWNNIIWEINNRGL